VRRFTLLTTLLALATPLTLAAQAAPHGAAVRVAATDPAAANAVALNLAWILTAAFLVMLVQAGFALVATGFTRAKNAGHTMTMNFTAYAIAVLVYWAVGFGLQAGGVGVLSTLGGYDRLHQELVLTLFGRRFGLVGTTGFFLTGAASAAPILAYFVLQMVFMTTAVTIPAGALAERWKFSAFAVFSVLTAALIYPIYANWVWGGGWLANLGKNVGLGHGHVDFAGSSVVHMTGGVMALVGAKLLGARRGKYGADGTVNTIPGHNIPMALAGTLILMFGWFGFTAGATLDAADLRITVIAANTMLASAAGCVAAMLYMYARSGKPDPSMLANGALAGLVAITAPCAFVAAPAAVLIGAVAGVLVCISVFFVERRLRLDDPVGAISVHGVNVLWGVLALGLFADGTYGAGLNGVRGNVTGLFYGDPGQLVAEAIGGLTNLVAVGTMTVLVWNLAGLLARGHRVSAEAEEIGLDLPEIGALAYPDTTDLAAATVLTHAPGAKRAAA